MCWRAWDLMRQRWPRCTQAARFEARLFSKNIGKRLSRLMEKELQVRDAVGWE
jgi:hypothetical protein